MTTRFLTPHKRLLYMQKSISETKSKQIKMSQSSGLRKYYKVDEEEVFPSNVSDRSDISSSDMRISRGKGQDKNRRGVCQHSRFEQLAAQANANRVIVHVSFAPQPRKFYCVGRL